MNQLNNADLPRAYRVRVLWALGAASAGCCLICFAHRSHDPNTSFRFLFWNLTLAWIPMLLAMLTFRLHRGPVRRPAARLIAAIGWLVFFPNAPYIVTDFVHLPAIDFDRRGIAMQAGWYLDLLIILSFAWTALCLGYLSLYLMQEIVRSRSGQFVSWLFAIVVLACSSFGIYLGRFSRWNSWDVFRHPRGLVADSVRAVSPLENYAPIAFCGMLFLFLLLSYCALFAMTNLHDRRPA